MIVEPLAVDDGGNESGIYCGDREANHCGNVHPTDGFFVGLCLFFVFFQGQSAIVGEKDQSLLGPCNLDNDLYVSYFH